MSDGFRNPIIGGSGGLVYPSIHSPGYAAGSTGWTVNKDGSAEFNNMTVRGTFDGTDYEINSSGAFFYSGTPALGNLIASIAPAPGTDRFGNAYPDGLMWQKNTNVLQTVINEIGIATSGNLAIDNFLTAKVNGDSAVRLVIDCGGVLSWGSGSAVVDTNLYRGAANYLQTDGGFRLGPNFTIQANDPAMGTGNPETWHPVPGAAFQNGWANAAGRMACSYKLLPHGWVGLAGSLAVPAGVIVGQNIFQITSAAYQPVQPKPVVGRNVTQNNLIEFNFTGTGILRYQSGTQAAGNVLDFVATLPLDI